MRKFSDYFRIFVNYILSLQKIGCTRQSESKLSLLSIALSLHKIGYTRQNIQASLILCSRLHYLCIR